MLSYISKLKSSIKVDKQTIAKKARIKAVIDTANKSKINSNNGENPVK